MKGRGRGGSGEGTWPSKGFMVVGGPPIWTPKYYNPFIPKMVLQISGNHLIEFRALNLKS